GDARQPAALLAEADQDLAGGGVMLREPGPPGRPVLKEDDVGYVPGYAAGPVRAAHGPSVARRRGDGLPDAAHGRPPGWKSGGDQVEAGEHGWGTGRECGCRCRRWVVL